MYGKENNGIRPKILQLGFRYRSLVEDYYTGFRLQCEGWKSAFCNPNKPTFLGDAPITLVDALNQIKRWDIGLLEVAISKYSPITFGVKSMGLLMGLCYANYAFWPILSIPITIYAFLPQFTLLKGISIFPEVYMHVSYAFWCNCCKITLYCIALLFRFQINGSSCMFFYLWGLMDKIVWSSC